MLRYLDGMLVISLVLLWALSHARVVSSDSQVDKSWPVSFGSKNNSSPFLYPRVDPSCGASLLDDPDVPSCRPLCAPSQSDCSSGLSTRNHKSHLNITAGADDTEYQSFPQTALDKRAFQNLNLAEIRAYVPQQTTGAYDTYFGSLIKIVQYIGGIDTDASFAQQRVYRRTPFQIGTTGLVGCTVVTVVSRRAVYMAHYWERKSWSSNYYFPRRVLNFISGREPREGVGSALDPTLFNEPDDDTRVYIMHPRHLNGAFNEPIYTGKFNQLKSLLNEDLLPGAPTATWMYIAVNFPDNEPDPIADQPWRRHAIFQYDPNAHGLGNKGWRLFYEDHSFDDTNPPPGPESANGIPDLP